MGNKFEGKNMNHLEKIWVKPTQFTLGFNKETLKYISWRTYTDTWMLVDRGIKTPYELPLFFALSKYYSEKTPKRLEFERQLLNLSVANPLAITAEWVKQHIQLYHDIKADGYKPHLRKIPITVKILNDGTLWLMDGTHTVSILMHLKRNKKIETAVHSREDGWINMKNDLYKMYGEKLLYQPTGHPDFEDWKIDRSCYKRWQTIKPVLEEIEGKRLLDIGSNTGYFSFASANLGFNVVGVDNNENRIKMATYLRKFHKFKDFNPRFFTKTFEDLLMSGKEKFDVALMLSLLHHYIRRDPKEAWKAINLINKHSEKLILELGVNRLPITWDPELVIKHSEYTSYEQLYRGERPIYLYE